MLNLGNFQWDGKQVPVPTDSKTAKAAGATIIGSFLPGGPITGALLGFVISSIRSATPRLDWNARNAIANPIRDAVLDALVKAGYYQDPALFPIAKKWYGKFVMENNPGQAYERPEFLNRKNPADLDNFPIWLALMYALSGVSTDPNDPSGVRSRVELVSEKFITPAVLEYEKLRGIESSSAVFAQSTDPVTGAPFSTQKVSLFALAMGAVVVGAFVFSGISNENQGSGR